MVVWNLGLFDTGSQLIDELPFTRPRVQSAVAHFGFAQVVTGGIITDRYYLLVSVTEHSLKDDGSGWERFGGPSFSIGTDNFPSPFLSDREYEKLNDILYPPQEANSRAQRVISRVVNTLERNLGEFSELGSRITHVKKNLTELSKLK